MLDATRDAVVYSKGRAWYGCLKLLGRVRVLLDASGCYCGPVTSVRLAGRFAALQAEFGKAPIGSESATLYDLSSGKRTSLASVWLQTPRGSTGDRVDSAALDSSGFAAWRESERAPLGIVAVSCPSESLCVAGQAGNILTSTDATGGPTAWATTALSSSQAILSVSCPTTSLCVAGDSAGDILTSTDPTGGATSWTNTAVDPEVYVDDASCPSPSLCVAAGDTRTGGGGDTILTSTDPTGGPSSRSSATLPSGGVVTALSCPSVSLCVATTNLGEVFTSTEPTGGANAWTKTFDPGGSLYAVSCPAVSFCVGADGAGDVVSSTDPAGGASTWAHATLSERLYAHDDRGTQVVDIVPPGQDTSIGEVTLERDSIVLSWTHDATRRQLELH